MGRAKKESEEEIIELDATVALEQAGNTLIMATEKANYNNDVEALMKIAGGWMEIHEYLSGISHHGDKKQALGFASSKPEQVEVEEEELDDAIAAEGRNIRLTRMGNYDKIGHEGLQKVSKKFTRRPIR